MARRVYTLKEFDKILNNNGYIKTKRGKHLIYTNGSVRIPVPSAKELSYVTTARIINKYNLKE